MCSQDSRILRIRRAEPPTPTLHDSRHLGLDQSDSAQLVSRLGLRTKPTRQIDISGRLDSRQSKAHCWMQAHPRKVASACSRRQLVHGVTQPSRRVPTGTVSNYGAPECAAARSSWREVRVEWHRSAVWRYWTGRGRGRIAGGVGGTRLDAGTALLRNSQRRLERPTTRLGSHAVLQLSASGLRTHVSRQTDVGLASLWCGHEDDIALAV
ncbi:hypothetical protein C8R43DRAFT_1116667 [Mycena crocata]|nr:hypothetical protein C8R43DRAFT_1116639 [Mycena crocata]KAJ7183059.1 hypothetical protein C8R43DRAFT_1116667 [Mycena crocata]